MMFNDTDNGETQYCPMCEEWAEKYKRLETENKKLKDKLNAALKNNANITELKLENEEWQKRYDIIQENRVKLWTDNTNFKQALERIKENCVEILATIAEEGKPNHSIVDTIWCKNIPCCTLWELVEGMQKEINEVLND